VVISRRFTGKVPDFVPHPLLPGPHLMTVAPAFWPRLNPRLRALRKDAEQRLFDVAPDVRVLAQCQWQAEPLKAPTLLIVHGLEGSSESTYVLGITMKAFEHGMNVVRMNLRNCGGSMHLTPTLYNGGLSADVICIINELHIEGFRNVFIVGYSLGGNIVMKAAGELGRQGPSLLAGVVAVSPSLDLNRCVQALEQPSNRMYELWFLKTLKKKIREKAKTHPSLYDVKLLPTVNSMRTFDDTFTAPAGGYGTADNYYRKASAINVAHDIRVPTLIIASEDDPLIPFELFQSAVLKSDHIELLATKYGGHGGFIHEVPERPPVFDSFWAENRVVEFCQEVAALQKSDV